MSAAVGQNATQSAGAGQTSVPVPGPARSVLTSGGSPEERGLATLGHTSLAAQWMQRAGSMGRAEQHPQWPLLGAIPLQLKAAIPLHQFRVRDLLQLREGTVVQSAARTTTDVPLRVGAVQLGWSEFELSEGKLAVRMTRLA